MKLLLNGQMIYRKNEFVYIFLYLYNTMITVKYFNDIEIKYNDYSFNDVIKDMESEVEFFFQEEVINNG